MEIFMEAHDAKHLVMESDSMHECSDVYDLGDDWLISVNFKSDDPSWDSNGHYRGHFKASSKSLYRTRWLIPHRLRLLRAWDALQERFPAVPDLPF
jgi:hypothetical protein